MKRNFAIRIFLFLIYPVSVFGAGWATFAAVRAGWTVYLFTIGIVVVGAMLSVVLQKAFPYEPRWAQGHGDTWADLVHTVVNVTSNQLGILLILFLAGLGVGNLGLWPTSWPFMGQFVLAVLLAELGLYWVHRLSHVNAFLWKFHAVHHSAVRLYWLNSERRHPVNHWLEISCGPGLVALLGCDVDVLAVLGTMSVVHLMFQHANVDYYMGPVRYVFAIAEMHRYHHLRDTRECMVNYGGMLAIWDLVFGTYCHRTDRVAADAVGIEGPPEVPKGYFGQLVQPFRADFLQEVSR